MPKVFGKKIYHSEDILGKIYDKVSYVEKIEKINIKRDKIQEEKIEYQFCVLDKLLVRKESLQSLFTENQAHLDSDALIEVYMSIGSLYDDFIEDVKGLLRKYHIKSESELMLSLYDTKEMELRCGKTSYKLRTEVSAVVLEFTEHYRSKSLDLILQHASESLSKKDVASVFYIVARNNNLSKKIKEIAGVSFYWLVMDYIISKGEGLI